MSRTIRAGLALVLGTLVGGCSAEESARNATAAPAAEQAVAAGSAITLEELESVSGEWLAAERSDDGMRAGARYTPDAVLVTVRGKSEGRQAITELWTNAFNAEPGSAGTQLETLKWGASGELAYTFLRYSAGVAAPGTNGHSLLLSERQPDGSLKIVAQISIPDPR